MTVKFEIAGHNGDGKERKASVHATDTFAGIFNGLVVFTKPLQEFVPSSVPFLNDSFGNQMNQNVGFSGTPEIITDGAGGGWTGSTIQGTWNFSDAGKVTVTGAVQNDAAIFDDAGTIDMSNYTAITGKVDLDVYNVNQNSINVQFAFGGSVVGNPVDLNDYIDTGDFAEQSFVIPKADLGISGITVDAMVILIDRTGGTKPTIKFDDIQIEQIGEPLTFTAVANGSDLHVQKIRFLFVDSVSSIVSASSTTYPTMPGLSYDQLLGINALTNGIDIRIVRNGDVLAAASIKQLGDFIGGGSDIVSVFSDGTNTTLGIDLILSTPIILRSGHDDSDFMSITINDDLSDLLQFTALVAGAKEL